MELMGCPELAVPAEVMDHVVHVESSYNPFAIGVVGGRLVRQPENLPEAVATARMLEDRGYNFSLGLAQVNRHNLDKYGLDSYEKAFDICPNLLAGSRILAECNQRADGDWDKSFSCYYSGNFVTGFRHGYVQKIRASMAAKPAEQAAGLAIEVLGEPSRRTGAAARPRGAANSAGRSQAVVRARIAAPPPAPAMPLPHALPQDASPVRLSSPAAGTTSLASLTSPTTTGTAELTAPVPQNPAPDAAFVF